MSDNLIDTAFNLCLTCYRYAVMSTGGGRYQTRDIYGGFFTHFRRKFKNFLRQIFQFMQKVIFANLTYIRPITPKFQDGDDFYKTNQSIFHGIRSKTPKSNWSYKL